MRDLMIYTLLFVAVALACFAAIIWSIVRVTRRKKTSQPIMGSLLFLVATMIGMPIFFVLFTFYSRVWGYYPGYSMPSISAYIMFTYHAIRCGQLPVIAFGATTGDPWYSVPGDLYYAPDIYSEQFFCAAQEAEQRGYDRGRW